jgi:hypothetical protein
MPWTSRRKDLAVTGVVPHPNGDPRVVGRAPRVTTLNFTPFALFGAMARCHYTHLVNPSLVGWEAAHMQSLLEQHVEDQSPDFAILGSADTMKDYVKAYFAGTVAAGLAYLAMISDGYVWSDHWENIAGSKGAAGVRKSPDFVFADPNGAVALMESKGSCAASLADFDRTVTDGYVDQVEKHLGHCVGGAVASHGYCIGSHMTSPVQAALRIHHTDPFTASAPTAGPSDPPPDVQRSSYASAFTLAHGPALRTAIREGAMRGPIVFFEFEGAGRTWLSSHPQAASKRRPRSTES